MLLVSMTVDLQGHINVISATITNLRLFGSDPLMANKRTEKADIEEQELREVIVEGESQNSRSAREYREFQKEWIKGACDKFEEGRSGRFIYCKRCKESYLRHHEARYVVQHGGLL